MFFSFLKDETCIKIYRQIHKIVVYKCNYLIFSIKILIEGTILYEIYFVVYVYHKKVQLILQEIQVKG